MIATTAVDQLADFETVVSVHQAGIFRLLFASLRDWGLAEELTQETLLRAYRARERFRGDASVRTWLMQIAVNVLRNHFTNSRLKFWRRTRRESVDPTIACDWLADLQSSPEARAQAKQQLAAVWEAAAALTDKQRLVFLLRFVEDMDLLEIAATTGMREGTVKAHLFRAVQAVRTKIEGNK